MTTARTLLCLCLVAACDKKSATDQAKPADKPTPVATTVEKPAAPDPACAAKVKAFEPWLAQLELERRSYEIDFGYVLHPIDRPPMPVPQDVDAVMITRKQIQAYDISEHNHVGGPPGEHATQKQLDDQLAKMKGMVAGKDERDAAPDDLVRVDVDKDATWGDVARVIDAATKAGYAHAVFAFTATSKLEQPAGVDAQTKTAAAQKEASDKLEALKQTCKPWDNVALRHHRDKDPTADAAAFAKETAAALAECNCAANPDEIRALAWKDVRWHQAVPRVGVTVALGGDKPTTIAQPAKTPWSEASAKLVEAAAAGPVKLVAK